MPRLVLLADHNLQELGSIGPLRKLVGETHGI